MKQLRDQYLKLVEWSDEDDCYIGSCPAIFGKGVHGDDEISVYKELCQVVDEWIEIYNKDGRPLPEADASKEYSGKFNLRVSPELHKQLCIKALQDEVSLNTYCIKKLS